MIITNKKNLPSQLQRALEREYTYQEKRYSVTSLLNPTRQVMLTRRHHHQLELDVSDGVWMLFGQGIHKAIEDVEYANHEKVEQKLEAKFGEYTLSGIVDYINTEQEYILDWKTTSQWTYKLRNTENSSIDSYVLQLKLYALLWFLNTGQWVQTGKLALLLKDYKKSPYPQPEDPDGPIQILEFDLGTFSDIQKWVEERFAQIDSAESLPDEDLPMCTEAERWNKGSKYAVMQNGQKRAIKVYDTESEAQERVSDEFTNGRKCYVEVRPGEDTRCLKYCSAAPFCKHWIENYKEAKDAEDSQYWL